MVQALRQARSLLVPVLIAIAAFSVGPIVLREPLGIALWAAVAAIALLPLAYPSSVAQAFLPVSTEGRASISLHRQEGLDHWSYSVAGIALAVGTVIFAGALPGVVIAAVAWSLLGGTQVLVALRLPAAFAIAAVMVGAALSLTWPIWGAGLLATHDLGPWLQRIVNISPPFALNAAIAPDDALTHRPLAYRLMNLGQDVNYAMPPSVWPCVLLHAAVGLVGSTAALFGGRRSMSIPLMPSANE